MKKEAQIDMQNSCLRDIYGKHMDLHKDIVDRTNLFIAILTFLLGLALYKIIDPSFFTLNKYLIASFACLGQSQSQGGHHPVHQQSAAAHLGLVHVPRRSRRHVGEKLDR